MRSPLTEGSKLAGIDQARGLAVLMVVYYHVFEVAFNLDSIRIGWNGWFPDFSNIDSRSTFFFLPARALFAGVPLFFVISGYCVHLSVLNFWRKDIEAAKTPERISLSLLCWFFARRFLRLWLPYLPALGLSLLILLAASEHWDARDGWLHLFLLHNLDAGSYFAINPSFWSLAIEWQLYLLYPVLLLLRSRWGAGVAFLCALGAGSALRFVDSFHYIGSFRIPCSFWGEWAFGMYLAERHCAGAKPLKHAVLLGCILLALAAGSMHFYPLRTFTFGFFGLGFGFLLERYIRRPLAGRAGKGLAWVGMLSYSLYLLHQPLVYRFQSWSDATLHIHPVIEATILFPILYALPLLLIAWIYYKAIEAPAHRLALAGSRSARDGLLRFRRSVRSPA
jgi:peptidoglycan/LPS O-acetylase OafA/YrhL